MRISARGIIIEDDYVYAIFRRRISDNGEVFEYYTIPGGGTNDGEDLFDTVSRELREEFSVNIEVLGYLGCDEYGDGLAHYFHCKIIDGTPILGGEELDRLSSSNYYEICKIKISEIDSIDIPVKDLIRNAFNKKYIEL